MSSPSAAAVPRSHVARWLFWTIWPFYRSCVQAYFRIRVHYADRIPDRGPVILAPTHRSRWDPLMLYEVIRRAPRFRYLRYLTSHDQAALGFQGWLVRRLGAFPINTNRPTPGAMKHCGELLESGQALVIFPEGNIFRLTPDEVHPLKPGAAWLSLQVQEKLGETPLTIVPIRLRYSDRLLRFRTRAEIEVMPPILVSDSIGKPRKEAIASLTAELQQALGDRVNDAPRPVIDAIARGEAPPPPEPIEASNPPISENA